MDFLCKKEILKSGDMNYMCPYSLSDDIMCIFNQKYIYKMYN